MIDRLHIRNFGKIRDVDVQLSEGINLCRGGNESGKTTFYYFLKGMFFGLPRKRGRGAGKDSYAQYQPWENPADFGGTLWFRSRGETYRLSRNFFRGASSFEFIEEGSGRRRGVKDLSNVLGDVGEAVYENTVSIGQLKSVTGPDLTRELMGYMASCQGAADTHVSLDKAMQFLKMHRKDFSGRLHQRRKMQEQELEKIDARIGLLEGQMKAVKNREAEAAQAVKKAPYTSQAKRERGKRSQLLRLRTLHKRRNLSLLIGALCLIGAVGAMATIGITWEKENARLFHLVFALVSCGFFGAGFFAILYGRRTLRTEQYLTDRHFEAEQGYKKQDTEMKRLEWNVESLKSQHKELEADLLNLREEMEKCEEEMASPQIEDLEMEAIDLAIERITEASEAIRANLGDSLRKRTSEILGEITEGKYGNVYTDEHFHMSVNEGQRLVDLERLSRGTVEQLYFSLRMASGELLCGKEEFPVILDDVFGMYDDERLGAVLSWLAAQNRQVVICSCNNREADIMEREGIPFTSFSLEKEA